MSLTAAFVDASFLFVLQDTQVLKEHHCPFVLCSYSITVMYWSKTDADLCFFVLPETDAVVFFAAENSFQMLKNTNFKEPMQLLVEHLTEAV